MFQPGACLTDGGQRNRFSMDTGWRVDSGWRGAILSCHLFRILSGTRDEHGGLHTRQPCHQDRYPAFTQSVFRGGRRNAVPGREPFSVHRQIHRGRRVDHPKLGFWKSNRVKYQGSGGHVCCSRLLCRIIEGGDTRGMPGLRVEVCPGVAESGYSGYFRSAGYLSRYA